MKSFNPCQNFPAQWRRGNALVLVSAMLVLLVLLATAFLARTQSQRSTASAMQDASGDDRRIGLIKDQLASEIAMHLFVKPINSNGAAPYIGGDSAGNRIPPSMYSVRYGVEPAAKTGTGNGDQLSNVVDPSIDQSDLTALAKGADGFPDGYNFAPYSVIPWTNWPDFFPTPLLGNTLGTISGQRFAIYGEPNGNPLGNPGFGDTRWLRSTEPVRIDKDGVTNPDGDRFSHWPHLSWLPTPANGYRVVKDIADIEANVLTGDMNQDTNDAFGTPYEQWLPDVTPGPISLSPGTDPLADDIKIPEVEKFVTEFIKRRDAWFTRTKYQTTMLDATAITMLPNFIKLDDPMGIGRTIDPEAKGVSKSNEWVFGPSYIDPLTREVKLKGTPRNIVSRTFCDTDGDGFTDSFWFLAPVGKERNVRTIIGVSVIDNSAMVDLNVATRADRRTTVGFTPSDIALVTSEPENSPNNSLSNGRNETDTLVGLFDNPFNQTLNSYDPGYPDGFASPDNFRVQFDAYRWAGNPTYYSPVQTGTGLHDAGQPSFLQALGLRSTTGTWNDYFYGQPVANATITPPTNEPFSGNMIDLFGASGPARPSQENPTYQTSLPANPLPLPDTVRTATFRAGIPNQPLVRPSERARWFRSAATGQGTMYAESLNGTLFESAPANDLFGIPVPTRRFDVSDELELRSYAGNNDPSSMSRLERSLNADDNMRDVNFKIADTILRSTVLRGEAGGGPDQLTNPQLLRDLRHKITVVSGQRNEIMPPWLWIGRPYGIYSQPNIRETFQNSMLWLGLHPETPGPRDENGNGRIDTVGQATSELGFGMLDVQRIACSNDPFPDGIPKDGIDQTDPTQIQIDRRDLNRAIRYFEEMNQKLDLRKPLLVTLDSTDNPGAGTPDNVPYRTLDGSLDQFMALSVNDQRLAMQDFVREARGRLRAALRIHSPMTPLVGQSFGLINTEMLGMNDQFADYTDRFYEQFLFTTNAKTRRAAFPEETLGAVVSGSAAKDVIAYRSAWSTEALTASMAANIATWRSRADLMFAPNAFGWLPSGLPDTSTPGTGLPDPKLPLRAIHQPILPDLTPQQPPKSIAYTQTPYAPLALRAVDPSKTTSEFPNYAFNTGTNPNSGIQPDENTADIVFPGIEKHPFFTEVFFGWVYPATTSDEAGDIKLARWGLCECPTPTPAPTALKDYKFVAIVNGKIGTETTSSVDSVKWYDGNDEVLEPDFKPTPMNDPKRDSLDEIRTPVVVVQVANPWNEPIRLGDFRINIFGNDYDFPDYELDASGNVVVDKNGLPIPLMLAPGTESQPATATVYLIANVLGNSLGASIAAKHQSPEDDLANVASWDPLFRRRWLDYFDLYEYSDLPIADKNSWDPLPQLATSPPASPLFPFTMKDGAPGAAYATQMPRSKLLNAMQILPGKKSIDLDLFKSNMNVDNMARGVTLQRVLKDPATGSAVKDNLTGKEILLEVDRFDAHSDFDHWSTTGTTPNSSSLPMFADDRNLDTNLVTGGRFWTAAARITLPPHIGSAAGAERSNLPDLLGAAPNGETNRFYDGVGASPLLFPPPTAKPLVRASTNRFRVTDITTGCADANCKEGLADSVKPPTHFPGIVLGEFDASITGPAARPSGDYFTTWTHVSRNWSRLFDAKFTTVGADPINPDRVFPVGRSAPDLPVWDYTRQLVSGSFASNPLPSDPIISRSPMIPVERFAPRFIFSNRTEPEFSNRPFIMQPTRIELSGVTFNRKLLVSGIPPENDKIAVSGTTLTTDRSQGDVFGLGSFSTPTVTDPDLWTVPSPWVADPTYGWMRATGNFHMLLTPVWAPLPDFCGLMPPIPSSTPQSDVVPVSQSTWPTPRLPSWPTLVLRKPTSFNCQTVIFNAGFNYYPKSVDSPLPPKVTAFYGNSRDGSSSFSDTKFVTPLWSVPAGSEPVKNTAGETFMPDGQYRVYMGDKGARLLDQDGFLLPIDLSTGSELTGRPWRARGLWNTLDRVPQAGSLQMLQKDDDFEQIGELLDVFAWGPAYKTSHTDNTGTLISNVLSGTAEKLPNIPSGARSVAIPDGQAKATFAEIMSNRVPGFPVGEGPFINRIQVDPLNVAFSGGGSTSLPYQFGGTSALRTPYAPNVPWGMRIFDCFTADGAGAALRFDWTDPKYQIDGNVESNLTNPLTDKPYPPLPKRDPTNRIEIAGSDKLITLLPSADIIPYKNLLLGSFKRPLGALLPVDVRSTINTPSTTSMTPQILAQWEYDRSPSLSGNFAGLPTKGLLNINTASMEAMKALPQMTMMVYEDTGRFDGVPQQDVDIALQIPEPGSYGGNRYVRAPLAIEIYRNQLDPNLDTLLWAPQAGDPMATASGNTALYPTYVDRGESILTGSGGQTQPITLPLSNQRVAYNTGMQSQRGITTTGELIGIARQSTEMSFTMRTAGIDPYKKLENKPERHRPSIYGYFPFGWEARDDHASFTDLDPLDARLSTDRQGVRQFDFINEPDQNKKFAIADRQVLTYDSSYGDSEELNLLFKGISNLVTTRSDVFTVYFKVRTVKQNPIDGKWNGTDREAVLDDARYVMCVDRTNVNRPSDQPRIVYFNRVPD